MRIGKISRKTKETEVYVRLNLDGSGRSNVFTHIKFLDHLLSGFAKHGCFDLTVRASGDLEHHIAEDVAIALGLALEKALGTKEGIKRMGDAIVPMDDALVLVALDLSGRGFAELDVKFKKRKLDDLSADMVEHFLNTFAINGKLNLHAKILRGRNDHHKAEAIFKALGISLAEAVEKERRMTGIPSTKGII